MKLKGKILALSLSPVILLGTLMFLAAADRMWIYFNLNNFRRLHGLIILHVNLLP